MLEEVREPRPSRLLMPGADRVPKVHGGQRYDVVLADHHPQPIAERVLVQWPFCHGSLPSIDAHAPDAP
ncbi:hypothetical protein GCM10009780_61790 [Actinomadura alba]